jgi:hypothetical protein
VGRALALVELERTLRMLVTQCDFDVLHNDHNLPVSAFGTVSRKHHSTLNIRHSTFDI